MDVGPVFDPGLLDLLQENLIGPWTGQVWRQVFEGSDPIATNTHGARWNPRNEEALYTSLSEEGVKAEVDYLVSRQPFPVDKERRTYQMELSLNEVVDLSNPDTLSEAGISRDVLEGDDHESCQTIGGAVAWLDYPGLLVPSARSTATNMVIFVNRMKTEDHYQIIDS